MWKFWFTLVANIGGWVALATLIRDVWEHRLRLKAYVFDYYTDQPKHRLLFAHFTLSNMSTRPVSVLKMAVKLVDGKTCVVSQNRGFIENKHYGHDYVDPLFTTQLPLNLPPKTSADALLEVINCDEQLNQIESLIITTDRRTKNVHVVKGDIRQVNQYQFR